MDVFIISYGRCAQSNFYMLFSPGKHAETFRFSCLPQTLDSCPGIEGLGEML